MKPALALIALLLSGACAGGEIGAVPFGEAPAMRGRSAASPVSNGVAVRYGAYEWNVDDAMTRWRDGNLWTLLASEHVDDFLAGFTDAQIARYSAPDGTAKIHAMIAQAAQHGIGVESMQYLEVIKP